MFGLLSAQRRLEEETFPAKQVKQEETFPAKQAKQEAPSTAR